MLTAKINFLFPFPIQDTIKQESDKALRCCTNTKTDLTKELKGNLILQKIKKQKQKIGSGNVI